jgi:hypothetical protein
MVMCSVAYKPGGDLPFPPGETSSDIKTVNGDTEGIEVSIAGLFEIYQNTDHHLFRKLSA